MYKPLPESLTIKQSGINGLGLFAEQKIMHGTNFGVSHYKKQTPKRRPGRHAKSPSKRIPKKKRRYRGQGR